MLAMNTVDGGNRLTPFSSVKGATSNHMGPSMVTMNLNSSMVKASNMLEETGNASFSSPVVYNVIAYL